MKTVNLSLPFMVLNDFNELRIINFILIYGILTCLLLT